MTMHVVIGSVKYLGVEHAFKNVNRKMSAILVRTQCTNCEFIKKNGRTSKSSGEATNKIVL